METKEYQRAIKRNNKYKAMIANLNKKLTVAYEVIDELRTERDRQEELALRMEEHSKWTDYL
jgi:hypothetical protein